MALGICILIIAALVLGYQRASLSVWTIAFAGLLGPLSVFNPYFLVIFGFWTVGALFLNIRPLRRCLVSNRVLSVAQRRTPKFSVTEEAVLYAGNIGWEAELFSGMPDWNRLNDLPWARISSEEQAFLDGPVSALCAKIDNWTISRSMQIPPEIWAHLKEEGYFGLVIPKKYGGKEFSILAHAQIIMKISGVSAAVASVVSVPNSLGPAELLLHYGTEEQKNDYLPRLARGEDIPCFALTSPVAGSDAAAITDYGVVCKAVWEGKEQICIRLHWNKRYITLAPVATLLGLAFKLFDPDHLLGEQEECGITCALIPVKTEGVRIGRRHYPLDCAFPNGPTQGENVLAPIGNIIGGVTQAGKGWQMLMERLAVGRGISLPSIAVGGAKRATLISGAYARIRRQFNTFIGDFGGVQDALAKTAVNTYKAEALRFLHLSQLDQGIHSATAAAISKYQTTELTRETLRCAMDIHGGKGICMGPRNYLAQWHIEAPIAITVEGANILTRSLIVFGQGALRCHPFLLKELKSARENDKKQFDRVLFKHFNYMLSNILRTFFLGLRNSRKNEALLSRFSAALSFITDVLLLRFGGVLKRKERLSARLGDVLSFLYVASAILKYVRLNEQMPEEKILADACLQDLWHRCQNQLMDLISNLRSGFLRGFVRGVIFPLGKRLNPASDHLTQKVAELIMTPGGVRDRLSRDAYFGGYLNDLEKHLEQIIAIEPLLKKIYHAVHEHRVKGKNMPEWIKAAEEQNLISAAEAQQISAAEELRMEFIAVDDFQEI